MRLDAVATYEVTTRKADDPVADGTERADHPIGIGLEVDVPALYLSQWHALVRLGVLLVDSEVEAEDVVQDAFVALQRNIATLHHREAALSYLRTSVVNGSRSRLRHRMVVRRHLAVAAPLERVDVPAADHGLIVASEHAALIAALRALPRRQREVLVLRYWSGLNEREIATTLDVSVGTVKSTASRGLDRLEAEMGGSR